MKQKLSVTVDKEVLKRLEKELKKKVFRNRSHVVEFALNKLLEEEE
tara:strand:- start:61 stop:198 length:138 start_codon:yes stop_codon:yes gene_type:complete